ncbi:MAG TPA: alpha amylase family protein [Prolixibacteraceae bacterium]|nr:alpha amylase family protein [Prolixibacteraceae bacterium]
MKKLFISLLGMLLIFGSCVQTEKKPAGKPLYMWFDCEANYERLSYPDSIAFYLDKVREIGFTDVVIDVKSIMGEVLYDSKIAPYMGEWKGVTRERDYDMIGIFIGECKKRDLRVHASLNIFAGGHNFHNRGVIFGEHAAWQSQCYWIDRIMPISEMKWNYNGMLNPALPEVQEYQISILKEVVGKYPGLDGVILDRARFDGITSDFSEASRQMFETYAGLKVENFPTDIIYWEKDEAGKDVWRRGQLFNKWVEWRAMVIHDFFAKARTAVKEVNPAILFGDYTGGWYPVYYELGVNWGSKNYDPSLEYDWATPEYKNSGYAELLDVYLSGLYFYEVTISEVEKMNEEAMKTRGEAAMGKGREYWYSVEGCAQLAKKVTMGAVPVSGTIYVDQYRDNKEQFQRAVAMAMRSSDGLGIFDIVHIIQKNWWDALAAGIREGQENTR